MPKDTTTTTTPLCLPHTFWLCVTDHGSQGFGSQSDPSAKFDDVVDQFIEAKDAGQPAKVLRIQPITGDCIDDTPAALERARDFWWLNGADTPEWADTIAADAA